MNLAYLITEAYRNPDIITLSADDPIASLKAELGPLLDAKDAIEVTLKFRRFARELTMTNMRSYGYRNVWNWPQRTKFIGVINITNERKHRAAISQRYKGNPYEVMASIPVATGMHVNRTDIYSEFGKVAWSEEEE